MEKEPVRIAVYLAALITSVGTFFVLWSQTGEWKGALGYGLLAAIPAVGGAEIARRHVTPVEAPATPPPGKVYGGEAGMALTEVLLLVIAVCVTLALLFGWDILRVAIAG